MVDSNRRAASVALMCFALVVPAVAGAAPIQPLIPTAQQSIAGAAPAPPISSRAPDFVHARPRFTIKPRSMRPPLNAMRSISSRTSIIQRPRIPVAEPVRIKLTTAAEPHTVRPIVMARARAGSGERVPAPPMLRPLEIDAILQGRIRVRSEESLAPVLVRPGTRAVPPVRGLGAPLAGSRSPQMLPAGIKSGTGINPWWHYQETSIPGAGRAMVNLGTGNVVVQDDDMSVPHKGIAMAFRRTYNSQMPSSYTSTIATRQSLYGNGWTNTFDAHLVYTSVAHYSVYDVDGARYDYVANGSVWVPQDPGNYATLVFDGQCGWLWTKKSGTTYYFWRSSPTSTTCPSLSPIGGYGGRLYQIIGRNRNTVLTLTYAWDRGDASATGTISSISVQAESGLAAVFSFGDVAGRRLLQSMTLPDGITFVSYGYDGQGNLTNVSQPPNNASGIRPQQSYGYQASGSIYLMQWAASPRFNACAPTCGSDGGYVAFSYATAVTPPSLTSIAYFANVNPIIPDGVSASPSQPSLPTNPYQYLTEYYTTGVPTPTFRDTDGHMTNWVMDQLGRPTQMQQCTASTSQGQQCTGTWLITAETWDANSNRTQQTDARGNKVDYAYDGAGNTIAIAGPQTTTSQGVFRPTSLYSYDTLNNLIAYCDPVATHQMGGDWSATPAQPPVGQGLCPVTSTAATRLQWSSANPSAQTTVPAEPNGELLSITTPGTPAAPTGYRKTFSYAPAAQGGMDYGLATSVVGDPITQVAGGQAQSGFSPMQTFQYDANGNTVCHSNGSGTSLMQYTNLNQLAVEADGDDSSISGCGKPGSSYQTASYRYFFPNGVVKYQENPLQHAADTASNSMAAANSFTYDLDGNVTTETHHHGCGAIANCTAGVTTKWYDGADRLIEVMQPYDATVDIHTYKWLTRYRYDLSMGGTQSLVVPASSMSGAAATAAFGAYGNLYDTQSYVDLGFSSDDSAPQWVDHLGAAYDAIDRKTAAFDVALGVSPLHQFAYDQSSTTLGFQSSESKPTGEGITDDYDPNGKLASRSYSYPGAAPAGAAPSRMYSYDAGGRVTGITSSLGTESYTYDAMNNKLTDTEPASQGGSTISYAYTGNGWRTSLTVSGALNEQLFKYSYRADGLLVQQQLNDNGWKSFTWSATPGGRFIQRTDPATFTAVNADPTVKQNFGLATSFQPLTYSYSGYGYKSGISYSDGHVVNNISTDLEENQSSEVDSKTFMASTGQYVSTHASMGLRFSARDELAFEGPSTTNLACCDSLTEQANGISVPGAPSGGPFHGYLAEFSLPNSPLHPLDGFEMASSGSNYLGPFNSNVVYDASGRLASSDLQQCVPDYSPTNITTWSEDIRQTTYDAENHTTHRAVGETQGQTSSSYDCTFVGTQGMQMQTYDVTWGTNNHPIRSDTAGGGGTRTEYLHWDGDTLLFTSGSPTSAVHDIKLGGFAEMTTGDGNIAVYDRIASGVFMEVHTTLWRQPNIPYNDSFGGGTLLMGCAVNGFQGPPGCVAITEPTPESLGGLTGGEALQGVRGVDSSLGHWTTPDAFAGTVGDPVSQMPFMYERGNPYRYSDPSGFDNDERPRLGWTRDGGEVVFNTPTSQRVMNRDGLPFNQVAAANAGAHGKIHGGLLVTAASAVVAGQIETGPLGTIGVAVASQYLQAAGEKAGEQVYGTIAGYTGKNPGPVDPAVEAGYHWLNIAGYGKSAGDFANAAARKLAGVGKRVIQKVAKHIGDIRYSQ